MFVMKTLKYKLQLFSVALLVSVSAMASSGSAGHGAEIPWAVIKAQAINLGLLLAILIYFIRKPLALMFEQKKNDYIVNANKTAEALKLAESDLAEIKKKITDVESTKKQVLLSAEKEAQQLFEKIQQDAKEQAKKIELDTAMVIAAEHHTAVNELKNKIIEGSIHVAAADVKQNAAVITKKSEKGFVEEVERFGI